ncbi:MAG: RnfABCDGE type electron transport complex subunit G [Natronincolaceae bacterium]|jgi:electron transport complex protein RnfG|nr:RnfABCDGE type electron transport complex subunit G [Bacillota bacterium]NLK91035.1 RnfABCDGE type electron transport complex subunit G [Clostridiales bacterium]
MQKVVKLGLILLIVTAVSAGALSVTNNFTKDIIEQKAIEANLAYMREILPDADDFKVVESSAIADIIEVEEAYEAIKGGDTSGYVIKTKTSGYGGDVLILTGINVDGTIAGMRVASQSETPNLGTKITEDEFGSQFEGLSTDKELKLNEDVDQVTGATISSTAAIKGINASIKLFESVLK